MCRVCRVCCVLLCCVLCVVCCVLAQAISCSNLSLLVRSKSLLRWVFDAAECFAGDGRTHLWSGCKSCVVVVPRPSSGHWLQATVKTAVAQVLNSVKLGVVAARREIQRQGFHNVQPVLCARGRRRSRSDPMSTKVSRLQAPLRSLGDGNVEERRALELALAKAQKQAEDLPVDRQIEVTNEFIKKRMLVRLAQVALQDAMEEKEYDMREVPLSGRSTFRTPSEGNRAATPDRQFPPIWKPRFRDCAPSWHRWRLRSRLCGQPLQSSSQAADMLRERAAKRRAGVTESIPTDRQDLLRDAIEFGDQESILSLTDLIQ